jgi:hypothetical protein
MVDNRNLIFWKVKKGMIRIGKIKRNIGKLLLLLCVSCSGNIHEITTGNPDTANTRLSLSPTFTATTSPTWTPSNTPNPRIMYEGDCEFCFLNNGNELTPIWDSTIPGWTYRKNDPREIITINDNYLVQEGENTTIADKIILVKPKERKDIKVLGTLIIENSLLIWQQHEYQQTRLRIMKGGKLAIKDSYSFWGNQYWVNRDFEDGSTIAFDHFVGDPWTMIDGSVNYTFTNHSTVKLTLLDSVNNSNIIIENAHHVWLEMFPVEGTYEFSLPEKRQWANWDIINL